MINFLKDCSNSNFDHFGEGDLPKDGDHPKNGYHHRDGDPPRDGGRLQDFYHPKGMVT